MKNKGLKIYSIFITYFILSSMSTFLHGTPVCIASGSLAVIRVFEKTTIDGEEIKLGDIAEIKGSDPVAIRQLKSVSMGKAPLPGKSRQIVKRDIKNKLRQHGFNLSEIDIKCCKKIDISRSFVEISKAKIKKIISDFIYKNISRDRNKIIIKDVYAGHSVILPKGRITYLVIPPKNRDLMGTIPFNIRFNVNRSFKKTVLVSAKVEVFANVVVAKRPIKRFHIITEDDICLKEMDLAKLPSNVIMNREEVLNKRAKRKISPQHVLRSDLIDMPPILKRGDMVSIIAESNGLKITAMGIVKGKGYRGGRVSVTNLDSGKRVYARVVDSNTVRVDF